jgi:MraZ protein
MSSKSYNHQLDAKNRMRIPAKLREELGSNYTITIGTGGCLYVYKEEQMQQVKKTLSKINPYKVKELTTARFILYNSWEAEEDKQGRILIPENLRKWAKIEKNVMVFKGPNCVEIWAEEVWNEQFKDISFDLLAEAFENITNND